MKSIFKFLTLLLFSHNAIAQSGSIFAEINYNTFSHSNLQSFQQEFVQDIPQVDLRVNDDFPAHVGFTVGYKINAINTSIFASYNSTGGKISYSDFSGVIRLTQPLNGYTLGGIYHVSLLRNDRNNALSLSLKGFGTYSTLDIQSYNETLGAVTEEEIGVHSIDYGVGVGLIYEYPISVIRLRASIGFDAVLGNKLTLNDNKDFYIEDNGGSAVKTGWSGLRTGIGIAIPI
ncbi:hypothetical protein [Flagellimonas sp.]|uniref:hypothetical protein n=1 Tax=Flagellimonas sp. TaxID=2058762 RepID=UPI003B524B8C